MQPKNKIMIESFKLDSNDINRLIEKLNSSTDIYEDEGEYYHDDYDELHIDNDLDFFIILLLLEFYKKGLNQVSFYQIIGYGLLEMSKKLPDIYDNYDDDFIYYIIQNLINNFFERGIHFFKIIDYTIDIENIYSNVVKSSYYTIKEELTDENNKIEDISWYYGNIISKIDDLKIEYNFKKSPGNFKFNITNNCSYSFEIFREAPKNIYINFSFDKNKVEKLEKDLIKYIKSNDFTGDYLVSTNNLTNYILSLDLIKESVRIPFIILGNKDFDFMKTIKLMEINKDLEFKNLLSIDDGYWEVKILNKDILNHLRTPSFIRKDYSKKVKLIEKIKILEKVIYLKDRGVFQRSNIEYEVPKHYSYFVDLLIEKFPERVNYEDIILYVKEKSEYKIPDINTYKGNLLKLLRKEKILLIEEDFINGKNKGYKIDLIYN